MSDKAPPTILDIVVKTVNYASIVLLFMVCIARLVNFGPTVKNKDDHNIIMLAAAPKDPFYYAMTLFLIPLALLMLASECTFRSVTKYFDFISQPCGRGIYFIFVALLLFDPRYRMDTIISIIVTSVGFLNVF
jgi:hypothetical protein